LQAEKFMKRAYFWAGFTFRQGIFLHIYFAMGNEGSLGIEKGIVV